MYLISFHVERNDVFLIRRVRSCRRGYLKADATTVMNIIEPARLIFGESRNPLFAGFGLRRGPKGALSLSPFYLDHRSASSTSAKRVRSCAPAGGTRSRTTDRNNTNMRLSNVSRRTRGNGRAEAGQRLKCNISLAPMATGLKSL